MPKLGQSSRLIDVCSPLLRPGSHVLTRQEARVRRSEDEQGRGAGRMTSLFHVPSSRSSKSKRAICYTLTDTSPWLRGWHGLEFERGRDLPACSSVNGAGGGVFRCDVIELVFVCVLVTSESTRSAKKNSPGVPCGFVPSN